MLQNFLSLASSAIALISLNIYFFINITYSLDGFGSIGRPYLLIFFLLGILNNLIAKKYNFKGKLLLRKDNIAIILFILFISIKLILEDPLNLFSYIFSTSGGIFTFFLMGLISTNCFTNITKLDIKFGFSKISQIIDTFYVSLSLIFSLMILKNFLQLIRPDSFFINQKLIEGVNQYQRTGDFILIFSFLNIIFLLKLLKQKNKISSLLIAPFSGLVFFSCNIASSLLIGSNKASLISIFFFMMYVFLFLISQIPKSATLIRFFFLKLKILKRGKINLRFLKFSFFIIIGILSVLLLLLNSDLYQNTRLSGYGEGASSITSRIALFKNFFVHFDFAPFWGNMNVDDITTGPGSYVHSIPFYLLTHTGVVGLGLFFISINNYVFYFGNRLTLKDSNLANRKVRRIFYFDFFLFCILLFSIFVGFIGSIIVWPYLWFVLGFCLPKR